MKIVECVPNFSVGKDKQVIEAIAKAIGETPGCSLLDVDPGESTNRTVYTFVGSPDAVVEGALRAAQVASQAIDMQQHQGEHPRLGALDVCPFIPVHGVDMDDCVACAKEFGKKLAQLLEVPVYLYGYASEKEYRKTVPQIRAGEYEGLAEKLKKSEWQPDFGPARFVPEWGATIAGARKFLIAFNVNLIGTKEQAHRIALNIREQGRGPKEPGRLRAVQAMGWYLQEANLAQISINLTDPDVTLMHHAYEECLKDAKELNLSVVGSEVVGLVPKSAMLAAADFYIQKENLFMVDEEHKVRLAIDRLGLNSLRQFNTKEKIIEYMIDLDAGKQLGNMTLKQFVTAVSSRSACPGGGSVSALLASLGAALGTMVAYLTYGNRKFEHLDAEIRAILPPLYEGTKELLPMVDADSEAFEGFMNAQKLPQNTEEEKKAQQLAAQEAIHKAIGVPLSMAKKANLLWPQLRKLAEIGNIQCLSDLQVGARTLETAVWGAFYNVTINLKDVSEADRAKYQKDVENELNVAQKACQDVLATAQARRA